MKNAQSITDSNCPKVTKLPDFQKFVFNFLQIIFSDQSVISIFPAENFPAGDWLKNDLQKIENKFSSGRHRGTSRLDEIRLSPRVRELRSRVLEPRGEICFQFFADHFFSVSPFFPKGKGRGTQKGRGYPYPRPPRQKFWKTTLNTGSKFGPG